MMRIVSFITPCFKAIVFSGFVLFSVIASMGFFYQAANAADLATNIQIRVTVHSESCDIYPGDEAIELDFGTITNKYLYLNTRTHSQPFAIRLINCDLSLGNEVKVTFLGIENPVLPGLVALDAGSQAEGVAVGLEMASGADLAINSGVYSQVLYTGNHNVLNMKAYVQGEPLALQNKSLVLGSWSATATFKLDYE